MEHSEQMLVHQTSWAAVLVEAEPLGGVKNHI